LVNPETLECVQPSCPLLPRCPSQGFPEKPAGFFNTDKLSLAAVGMRRKNFMVVEVDVYLVALSLSPSALLATKNWKKAQTGDPLAEVILQQGRNLKVSPAQDESMATATLRFVRAVGKSQIVEAFSDAFKGVDPAAVTAFKDALAGAIPGDAGLKVGDEFRCVGVVLYVACWWSPPLPCCASHPHRLLPFLFRPWSMCCQLHLAQVGRLDRHDRCVHEQEGGERRHRAAAAGSVRRGVADSVQGTRAVHQGPR
jgi:hypothetical protein